MKKIKYTNNYESVVVLSSQCTEAELKIIAFSYARQLKKLGASEIYVISRGRRDFISNLKKTQIGYFVEIYFNSSPQILPIYQNKLKLDKNVVKSLIINQN